MHPDHDNFVNALHARQRVLLHFFSKEDGTVLRRTCAPLDFGPSRRAKDQSDRYHFWDYDSDTVRHVLSLLPDQIQTMSTLDDMFDPGEFITWDVSGSPWFLARDWGQYS